MATQGPNSPSTATSESHGTSNIAWTNTSNALTQDDTNASVSGMSSSSITEYLKVTNFGFSIPGGATVTGITVEAELRASAEPNGAEDEFIRLVKGGTVSTAVNRADATDWPSGADSDTYKSWGGGTDLWGETWTDSDINSSGFGAAISGDGLSSASQVFCDHVRITVTYDPAPPAGSGGMLLLGVG